MAAFQAAAAAVAEKQAEEKLSLEERVTKHIRKWSEDWEKVGCGAGRGRVVLGGADRQAGMHLWRS
jgi:hypothetical protein